MLSSAGLTTPPAGTRTKLPRAGLGPMLRLAFGVAIVALAGGLDAFAEDGNRGAHFYGTALGGFAILSGGSTADLGQSVAVSLYQPVRGLAFNGAGGWLAGDWIGLQANYIFNRNDVRLVDAIGPQFVERNQRTRQDAWIVDALFFVRPRSSWLRPYLSFGLGAVRYDRELISVAGGLLGAGAPAVPRPSWHPGIRIAVGADLLLRNGWGFRYSFSETVTRNFAGNDLLRPPTSQLMNFQNLFGVVRYFGR